MSVQLLYCHISLSFDTSHVTALSIAIIGSFAVMLVYTGAKERSDFFFPCPPDSPVCQLSLSDYSSSLPFRNKQSIIETVPPNSGYVKSI